MAFNATVYNTWSERNNMSHGGHPRPAAAIIRDIHDQVQIRFQSICCKVINTPLNKALFLNWNIQATFYSPSYIFYKWNKPPIDYAMINSDGSCNPLKGGISSIIRNHLGDTIAAACGTVNNAYIIELELCAMLQGIKLAIIVNQRKVILNSDSLLAVKYVKGLSDPPWHLADLVSDIINSTHEFEDIMIDHIYREANMAADFLANLLPDCVYVRLDPNSLDNKLKLVWVVCCSKSSLKSTLSLSLSAAGIEAERKRLVIGCPSQFRFESFWTCGKMPEKITAENLLNNLMETLTDNVSVHKSSSHFVQDKSISVSEAANRLFGREKPVHHLLGGGKSADVLLWRNKKISASVLTGATAIWVLFEWLNYNFFSLVFFALLLLMLGQFAWSNTSNLINRSPSQIPRIVLPEELFVNIGISIGKEVNRFLSLIQDIASGGNLKQFLMVVLGLWAAAVIGSWCNFLTVLYIGFVAAHTLPVLYEKYEDQVDEFVYSLLGQFQHHYRKLDSSLLSRIPKGKLKGKKSA